MTRLGRRVLGAVVPRAIVSRAAALGAVLGAALLAVPAPGAAQGRIANARIETRSAARGLENEVRSVAARPGAAWVGYRVPMVAGPRQMCCYDTVSDSGSCCGGCRLEGGSGVVMNTAETGMRGSRITLEPPTEFLVLARLEGARVNRVRTFTPDCDVDGGGISVVWLTDVKPDESIAWLSTLIASVADAGAPDIGVDDSGRARIAKPALGALALHDSVQADRALETLVAPGRPEWLRGDASFWLGSARGEAGARLLARMITADPSDKVREKVTFALSVSKASSALTTLVAAAKNDRSTRVRGQALFWLAHKAGQEAVAAITNAIRDDPETEVKKKAVFALSQLPKDEGVPKLIEVARTNRNPEVRKQAFFWLGQSHDPRAVLFFEEVLAKK